MMKQYYLKPGEAIIVTGQAEVTTVLGSCVSVIFFSPSMSLGAITHGILPVSPINETSNTQCNNNFKYVDSAIRHVVRRIQSKGMQLRNMQVKIFGGADVIGRPKHHATISVGQKNIESALRTLDEFGIMLHASDVGGTQGRKIIFQNQTGRVLLKRLRAQSVISSAPLFQGSRMGQILTYR